MRRKSEILGKANKYILAGKKKKKFFWKRFLNIFLVGKSLGSCCKKSELKMSNEVKISKLTEAKEWTLWKLQVKVVLRSLEVFDVVDGKVKEPQLKDNATSDETAKHLEEYAKFEKKDVKAQSVIVTSIAQQPPTHIVNCKTAFEMWNKLHSVFEQKSETGIHLLQQKFFTFEKDPEKIISLRLFRKSKELFNS